MDVIMHLISFSLFQDVISLLKGTLNKMLNKAKMYNLSDTLATDRI